MFSKLVRTHKGNKSNLKWIILSLHDFLQTLFILSLAETSCSSILERNKKDETDNTPYDIATSKANRGMMKHFEELYAMFKKKYTDINHREFGVAINYLNNLRNDLIHFKYDTLYISYNDFKTKLCSIIKFLIIALREITCPQFCLRPLLKRYLITRLSQLYSNLDFYL
ncbi:hypothetical protein IJX73_02170 [bacterium]|nr:hypothetical protein [bacterium]